MTYRAIEMLQIYNLVKTIGHQKTVDYLEIQSGNLIVDQL